MSARAPARLPRAVAWGWGAAAVGALALAPLAPALLAALPACPLRAALDLACPGCGSGRALAALAALDPMAALAWNPLAATGALGFVALGLVAAGGELAGRPLAEPRELGAGARAGLALLLAGNWLYLLVALP